jgi:hypothetical protein
VAFIKQEALEKAREIQVKADEEFAIEKVRVVRLSVQPTWTDHRRADAEIFPY